MMSKKYDKERKKFCYHKNIPLKATCNSKDEERKNLQQSLSSLEGENEMLKEEVESMLQKAYIHNFGMIYFHIHKNGKYRKEIRMLYYDLLCTRMNLSVRNFEKVVGCVLEKLGDSVFDKVPSEIVAIHLMFESRVLAQTQVADSMQEGEYNVLHIDGTRHNFEENGSFRVVTPSGAYVMSIEDTLRCRINFPPLIIF